MRRKLGINIDGVVRDYLSQFEKVYTATYISNPSLIETDESFTQVKILTNEEEDVKMDIIKKRMDEMITRPIDSFDLMNHFKFEAGKNYIGDEVSAEKIYEEFVNEIKAFHIFGQANAFKGSIDSIHRLQQLGGEEDLFDIILLSTLKGKAVTATYSFLAASGVRIKNTLFVEEDFDKWDYCDAIIDIMPETFQSKPDEGLSVKINHDFNKWDDADLSYDSLQDAFKSPEFIERIREFYKNK